MHSISARLWTGNPFRFAAGRGDLPIESHGCFHGYEWGAVNDPMIEGFVEAPGFFCQTAACYANASLSEQTKPFPPMGWIGIGRSDDNVADTCCDDRVGAWGRAAECATWFQRDVKGGPFRIGVSFLRSANGLN